MNISSLHIEPKNPPVHVYPVDDLIEHKIDDINDKCECVPVMKVEGETIVVIHNAIDGRL